MPVVHTVAEAHIEGFAVVADALACPLPVSEWLETGLPDIPEVVGVDIALGETCTVDVGTGADGAVNQYGGNVYPCMAEIGSLPHLALVATEITLAAEGDIHWRGVGGAFLCNEVHELYKLAVSQVQFGIVQGTADRYDGKDAPLPDTHLCQLVVDGLQMR